MLGARSGNFSGEPEPVTSLHSNIRSLPLQTKPKALLLVS